MLPAAKSTMSQIRTDLRGPRAASVAIRGGAQDNAKWVGRDDMAGSRDRDTDPAGDLREQTHGDELGCADGESPDRERKDREVDMSGEGRGVDAEKIDFRRDPGAGHC